MYIQLITCTYYINNTKHVDTVNKMYMYILILNMYIQLIKCTCACTRTYYINNTKHVHTVNKMYMCMYTYILHK